MITAGLGLTLGVWVKAQSANAKNPPQALPQSGQDKEPPMTPEREVSLLAIQQPVEFEAEVAKHKTKQDELNLQISVFSISQPKAYAAEFEKFKDDARRKMEKQARFAILNPVAFRAKIVKTRDKAAEQAEELAANQMMQASPLSPEAPGPKASIPGKP